MDIYCAHSHLSSHITAHNVDTTLMVLNLIAGFFLCIYHLFWCSRTVRYGRFAFNVVQLQCYTFCVMIILRWCLIHCCWLSYRCKFAEEVFWMWNVKFVTQFCCSTVQASSRLSTSPFLPTNLTPTRLAKLLFSPWACDIYSLFRWVSPALEFSILSKTKWIFFGEG